MSEITVRQVYGEEMLRAMYWMHAYAFSSSPPLRDRAEREEALLRRQGATHMAAYDGDELVACGASRPLIQQVRGALYPMAGLMDVTTHPATRRRGYARKLLGALLEAVREGGAACSGLYPFRESFYERLGYVTLPQVRRVRFDPAALQPLLRWDLGGQVRLLPIEEGYEDYLAFLQEHRARTHGMAMFQHDDRYEAQRGYQWVALATVGQRVEGVMLYNLRGEQITRYALRAFRFYHASPAGRYLLLEWIARHIDQADRAELTLPAYERPETWLADLRLQSETASHITPMARVLDVARIAGLQTGPGAVAVRLSDPACPWNEGIWRLASVGGRLEVAHAGEAQGALTIQGLTALVYGTHDPAEFGLRGWGALDAATVETLRAMFPPRCPHLHEMF